MDPLPAFRAAIPAVALAAACWSAPAPAAGDGPLAPHRAFYTMSLAGAVPGSEIVDMEGAAAFEWREDCDGWIVEQRIVARYRSAERPDHQSDNRYTAWESKDGKRLRFFSLDKGSGAPDAKTRGVATRPDGAAGVARFAEPEAEEFALPADALFPSAHTFALLERARAGARFFAAPLFDGGELEGAAPVTAAIGLPRPGKPEGGPLLSVRYWPIRMAFFGYGDRGSGPEYEISADLHENAVASALTIDYGEFSVAMALERIEAVEPPSC